MHDAPLPAHRREVVAADASMATSIEQRVHDGVRVVVVCQKKLHTPHTGQAGEVHRQQDVVFRQLHRMHQGFRV